MVYNYGKIYKIIPYKKYDLWYYMVIENDF